MRHGDKGMEVTRALRPATRSGPIPRLLNKCGHGLTLLHTSPP